ncbi:5-deoxy-glucuronate isomerase [Jiangella ureilytica]|uniref:5-deoxy-glucuronate isomerase n=1 Tax=Jiangella ureilytica TaxID=2530374 RepID=A0A4R4RB00_9ACTN|nr:5-deoxy-glucuronate isomerase [Jiangella ureilytica]TDC46180.1 5-deoxy-glucuronate isomerase [Jiangella ureilytica]
MSERWHWPAGSAGRGPYATELTPSTVDGWRWTSLRVVELGPGETHAFDSGDEELFVLPLSGGGTVVADGERFELAGRPNVFSGPTDTVYVPRDASVTVTAAGGVAEVRTSAEAQGAANDADGARFALPAAPCSARLAARYLPADAVAVEIRGAGQATRQVHNFGSADTFEADRLIAVEVVTPAGNWSSYPPHKHDVDEPGQESELEEIYYFEVGDGPNGPGIGYHRVYGTPARPIDVIAEVRTGDVVLVPHGWHGPSMAAPGYHLYYLNVMAGPGAIREWLISDDPAHAWVREEWASLEPDPRLPMGRITEDER